MSHHRMEHAHHIKIGSCGDPRCGCVHLQFCDHDDVVFAQAAIPVSGVPAIIDDFQRVTYFVVAGGKEDEGKLQ